MSGWHLFVPDRIGTPITEKEREWLEEDLRVMEAHHSDEEWIANEVKANIELMGSWDRDLTMICFEHDINMLRRTLETGIVTEH